MKKTGKLLCCLLPIVVALLCQFAVIIGATVVYGAYLGMKMGMLGITEAEEQQVFLAEHMDFSGDALMLITAVATALTLLVGALWYRSHKPATDFNLKQVVNGKLIAAMACLGLSLQFLISMCLSAVYPVLTESLINQYGELMESLIGGNIWLSLLVTVILAPLAEEFLFRGLTMKMAQKVLPFMAANVIQAILFGIYHMNVIQGVYAFVLGLILGFTAEYFHSVWASVLLHAFVNGSAEVLALIPEAVTKTYIGIAGIAMVGVVLLFVAAKLYPLAKKERFASEPDTGTLENEMFRENSFDE